MILLEGMLSGRVQIRNLCPFHIEGTATNIYFFSVNIIGSLECSFVEENMLYRT